jgi:Domain of unknown function (DUF4167)
MRQGGPNNGRRSRGRHHGGHGGGHGGGHNGGHGGGHQGGGGNGNVGTIPGRDNRPRSAASLRHQTFDSNCIDMRVRGNAWQVYEKYQALARDAQSAGDRVAAENYLQHAEHYFRIIEAINEATAAEQRARGIVPGAPGQPGQPDFGAQPATPSNYYGAPGGQPGATQPSAEGQPAEATATPTAAANPFFSAEEAEEQAGGPAPLVATRR